MEQKAYRPLAIDADSLVFIAYHRHKNNPDEELMYQSVLEQIHSIKFAYQSRYAVRAADVREFILLTPLTTFRNKVYPRYKNNRSEKPRPILNVKQKIYERLKIKTLVYPEVEADDIIVNLMNCYGYVGSAIDKDVVKVSRMPVYNYKRRKWINPEPIDMSEEWYVMQCLTGDMTDGIRGAKGVGPKGAENFIVKHKGQPPWEAFCEMFEDGEEEAIATMRVIRMDQWDIKKGLTLWTPDKWKWRGAKC